MTTTTKQQQNIKALNHDTISTDNKTTAEIIATETITKNQL